MKTFRYPDAFPLEDAGLYNVVKKYKKLDRKPTPDEAERYGSYVDRGGPTNDPKKALADVFWVLLNSTEFLFNH